MRKAWYVRLTIPIRPNKQTTACSYLCSETHPMDPDYFRRWSSESARNIGLATGSIVRPEDILIDFLYELPIEVAKVRFPDAYPESNQTMESSDDD